jgi:nucleotide-binding universal stress UspA family protein
MAGAIKEMYRLGEDAPSFCKVDNLVTTGTPWREVVRIANQVGADLIVMGAHGPAGVGELFLGSTAAQTVRHAPCPVLLTRSEVPAMPAFAVESMPGVLEAVTRRPITA